MQQFAIMSDTASDLPEALVKQLNIELIPYYISFDKVTYKKEREELSVIDFYKELPSNFPKTSLPSVQDFIERFEKYAKAGIPLLHINLTQKFSGSYQAATNAREIVIEEYPKAEIYILDSRVVTSLQGLLVTEAARMRDDGLSLSESVLLLEKVIPTGRIMYTIDTLEYLQKGGRIGKVGAMAGALLNLKPLIVVKDGELFPYGNIRGRKKSLDKVVQMTLEHFETTGEKPEEYNFVVTKAMEEADALEVKNGVAKALNITYAYEDFVVGCTIGTYCGPGTVGIAFIKDYLKL